MSEQISGFVAYPSVLTQVAMAMQEAVKQLKSSGSRVSLQSWEENDIAGRFIAEPILGEIEERDVLVADITNLNFNVVFEIGYAIGVDKRVLLVKHGALSGDDDLIRQVGIFDTLGFILYSSSSELVSILSAIEDLSPLKTDFEINERAPIYLLSPRKKTDFEIRTVARVKKARIPFRSHDPEEHGRLAAREAIENVAQSQGVIAHLLPAIRSDASVQNVKAAFVAGLTQGMRKELLLIQQASEPVPLDYRDLVASVRRPDQIDEHVGEFAAAVAARITATAQLPAGTPVSFLGRLNLGASSAENELGELQHYYLETDEFQRALRKEVQVVTGRKGSGKTALFLELRNRVRADSLNVVLDLRPEGYQLLKFKEKVLDMMEEGTREHTITAFWEYLLLLEICHKLLQKDRQRHLRDHRLFEPYRELADSYSEDYFVREADFAERMTRLTKRIADDFEVVSTRQQDGSHLARSAVTELIYKHDLRELRDKVTRYLKFKGDIWVLFDNLDKGWPPHGVGRDDLVTVRCLMDALLKLERELKREALECRGIIFIRNDVYDLMIDSMPDRGKLSKISVDWTDSDLLRELLRRRFVYTADLQRDVSFKDVWPRICVSHIGGEETSQYLIDRSLMRPRGLIELLQFCRSHAVNLGHTLIEETDILKGEEAYSTELVTNISFEIRDVLPSAEDILYELIECSQVVSLAYVRDLIAQAVPDDGVDQTLDLLLWYAVFGSQRSEDETTYIYDVHYDLRRLKAVIRAQDPSIARLRINPAFWKGLGIPGAS